MEGLAKVAAAAAVEGMDAAEAADAGATGARGRASAAAGAMRLGARLVRRGASVAARSGVLFGASALLPARVWRGVAILAMAASPPCRKRICEMLGGGGGGGTPGYNDGGAGPPIERALAEVDARMKWLSVPAAAVFALEGMLAHFSPGDRRALGFWRRMMPIFLRYIRVQRAVRGLPAEKRHARWDQTHEWGGEKASGILLHAKFLDTFAAKAEEELSRRQHYSGSVEYKAYAERVRDNPELWCKWSEKYINWRQLEILGLMSKGNWA